MEGSATLVIGLTAKAGTALSGGHGISLPARDHRYPATIDIPRRLQPPRPPSTIGGDGEQETPRLVVRCADSWTVFAVSTEVLKHAQRTCQVPRDRAGGGRGMPRITET